MKKKIFVFYFSISCPPLSHKAVYKCILLVAVHPYIHIYNEKTIVHIYVIFLSWGDPKIELQREI